MFDVLQEADALSRLIPTLDAPTADPAALPALKAALVRASRASLALPARFGLLALASDSQQDASEVPPKDNAGARLGGGAARTK